MSTLAPEPEGKLCEALRPVPIVFLRPFVVDRGGRWRRCELHQEIRTIRRCFQYKPPAKGGGSSPEKGGGGRPDEENYAAALASSPAAAVSS
jgi:hypothetical protein